MKTGDEVTIVGAAGAVRARVEHVGFSGFECAVLLEDCADVSYVEFLVTCLFADKGVCWIHGHHDPDSDAIHALLASAALAK